MSHDRELRIVIVGKLGNGKSSLGNNLLGTKVPVFDCRRSKIAVTMSCKLGTTKDNERDIKIVDTPGLFTPTVGNNIAKQALDVLNSLKCFEKSPHAFLLVLRDDSRYSEEDSSTIAVLEMTFGSTFFQHAIAVFTHTGNEIENQEFEEEWKKSQELTRLIAKCGNRVARIDNMSADSAHIEQILSYVDQMSMEGMEYKNKYEHCQRKVLEEMKEFDQKFNGKTVHEQVSDISVEIKFAIRKEELMADIREREEAVSKSEKQIKALREYFEEKTEECENKLNELGEKENAIKLKEKNVDKNFDQAKRDRIKAAKTAKSTKTGMIVVTVVSGVVAAVVTSATGGVATALGLALARAGATGATVGACCALSNWLAQKL